MREKDAATYPRSVESRSRRPPGSDLLASGGSTAPPPLDAVVVDLESFHASDDPVLVFDADDLTLLDVNERARVLLAIDLDASRSMGIDVLVGEGPPFDRDAMLHELTRATRLGSHRFSWRTTDAHRQPIFLELTIRLARIGGERRFLVVAQDQTEKIALLEALERTTAVLRNAVSRSPVAIILFDAPDGRIRLTNRAAEVMRADATHYSLSAIDAFRFTERDGTPLRDEDHPFRRVLERGESLENAQLAAIVDGRRRFVLVHAAPILSNQGEIISSVAIIPDVTDVVRAEAALLERDKFLHRFYERAREVIFGVDADGYLVSVSPAVRDVLGHSPSDLVGLRIGGGQLLDVSETNRVRIDLERILAGEFLESTDYVFIAKDGRRRVGEVTGSPIEDRDRRPTAIFVMRDVTERRLADERRAAMETSLRKRQRLETVGSLASGVAHEINNPLTGILNLAEMLELDIVPHTELQRTGTRIRALCERMATIVAELMALARSEPDEVVPVDLAALVQSALDLIHPQLRRARIVLSVSCAEGLPRVRGRSQPLVQALLNVLGNALEALAELGPSEPRAIAIHVHSVIVADRELIRTTVTDNGRGVEPSLRDSIFEPFVTTKEQQTGAGLGLWVSRGIAAEHGGRLWHEDAYPTGAQFHLDLPVDRDSEPAPKGSR